MPRSAIFRRLSVCALLGLFAGTISAPVLADPQPDFSRATKEKNLRCPSGSFFDAINGGTCWQCPGGTERTVFPVTGANACEKPARTEKRAATNHGRGGGLLGTDCASGRFWDPNGNCYSCPNGFSRTGSAVTAGDACARGVAASPSRATSRGALRCGNDAFFDPIHGGSCWSCGDGETRTVFPVDGAKACESTVVSRFLHDNGLSLDRPDQLFDFITRKYGIEGVVRQIANHVRSVPESAVREAASSFRRSDFHGVSRALSLDDLVRKLGSNTMRFGANETLDSDIRFAGTTPLNASVTLMQVSYPMGGSDVSAYTGNPVNATASATINGVEDNCPTCAPGFFKTLTTGIAADGNLGVTGNLEFGVAWDVTGCDPWARAGYFSPAFGMGTTVGADAAFNVGLWTDEVDNIAGDVLGFTVAAANVGGASLSVFAPQGRGWKLAGIVVGLQAGLGVEAEYAVGTTLRTDVLRDDKAVCASSN